LSPSDGLKDIEKGFLLTDMSGHEPRANWIKLENRRPVLVFDSNYKTLQDEISALIRKTQSCKKKPIVVLTILGEKIDSKIVAMNLSRLNESCLHYVWRIAEKHDAHLETNSRKPVDIDRELYRLTREALNSDELAAFAINEILPAASAGDLQMALDIIWKLYNNKKKTRN
jgi:hypothetical protein